MIKPIDGEVYAVLRQLNVGPRGLLELVVGSDGALKHRRIKRVAFAMCDDGLVTEHPPQRNGKYTYYITALGRELLSTPEAMLAAAHHVANQPGWRRFRRAVRGHSMLGFLVGFAPFYAAMAIFTLPAAVNTVLTLGGMIVGHVAARVSMRRYIDTHEPDRYLKE